jgi:hypothetical protein
MKLVPASSPGMEAAHRHTYVRTIVDILMQDRNLLRPTARFLKKYSSGDQPGFKESLDALRLFRSRSDSNGVMTTPEYVITLTQTLMKLYQQRDMNKIKYQRGAIVELLVRQLIRHRYNRPGDLCLNNQRFVENYQNITVKEVDVAALSTTLRKVEGYECKVSPSSFEPYDVINLSNLADAASDRQYRANVGFVAFESDYVMKIKLIKLQLSDVIKLYGLDSIEFLQNLPLLDN